MQICILADQDPGKRLPQVFLAGDFSSEPDQEAYKEMTSSPSPMADLQRLVDERTCMVTRILSQGSKIALD